MTQSALDKKCPVCNKQSSKEYSPFCSKKCADIDLGRWLKGNYVIHTDEKPKNDDYENQTRDEE